MNRAKIPVAARCARVWRERMVRLCVPGLLALLQACASVPNPNPRDPWEPLNRGIFSFNEAVDKAVVKPVATAYRDATPHWLRTGVGNFFNNLEDAWSAINNALQLRRQATGDSMARVLLNTTIGLGGVMDVASDFQVERHSANFGLTLGRWGVGSGPYVVLPFLGPSTLRDTVALPVDLRGDPRNGFEDAGTRDALLVLKIIDTRATYLRAGEIIEGAALDKYSFMRDGYLQRRRNQIYDGNPPDEEAPAPQPEP